MVWGYSGVPGGSPGVPRGYHGVTTGIPVGTMGVPRGYHMGNTAVPPAKKLIKLKLRICIGQEIRCLLYVGHLVNT